MSNETVNQNEILIELKLYYLDDEQRDLNNFKNKVDTFNRYPERYFVDLAKIKLEITTDPEAVIDALDGSNYDVFVCDHNMPEKKGLELIVSLLKPKNPNTVFVLYTGANLGTDLKNECKDNDIIFFEKTEEFETLLARIVKKVGMLNRKAEPYDPQKDLYLKIAKDLLIEMQEIEKIDPDFIIQIGEKEFRPSRMIKEINSQSEYGLKYLDAYFEGLKFFKDK
jgi:CheY-like chemotaxis protein